MTYAVFEDEHYYICHDGRELRHIRTESKEMAGYTQTVEVYGCADCSGCTHKSKCLYRYSEKNPDRNKVMKINERWEELREESNANIQSGGRGPETSDTVDPDRRPLWRYQRERKVPAF